MILDKKIKFVVVVVVLGCSLTPPYPSEGQGEKIGKTESKLVGRDKDREITYQLLSRAKQTHLGEN